MDPGSTSTDAIEGAGVGAENPPTPCGPLILAAARQSQVRNIEVT